jgi:hypothetical protein
MAREVTLGSSFPLQPIPLPDVLLSQNLQSASSSLKTGLHTPSPSVIRRSAFSCKDFTIIEMLIRIMINFRV